jgi:mRNA-degrading endonuclease RelE of RelBE toxin-antitoxin system
MKIFQSRSFEKNVKKFSQKEKKRLDEEIKKIAKDAAVGEEKKGDLRGVFVYKFIIHALQYLLSYRLAGDRLEVIMIGSHENYYRDLKRYIKKQ